MWYLQAADDLFLKSWSVCSRFLLALLLFILQLGFFSLSVQKDPGSETVGVRAEFVLVIRQLKTFKQSL